MTNSRTNDSTCAVSKCSLWSVGGRCSAAFDMKLLTATDLPNDVVPYAVAAAIVTDTAVRAARSESY